MREGGDTQSPFSWAGGAPVLSLASILKFLQKYNFPAVFRADCPFSMGFFSPHPSVLIRITDRGNSCLKNVKYSLVFNASH